MKSKSVFYTKPVLEAARANAAKYSWAAELQGAIVGNAEPWLKLSDDELWQLMFGNTITRSWMVWSNGYCPACKQDVLMYNWEIDAFKQPWKVRCPHCRELFPKNDFHQFYRSGINEQGVFAPERANRALLFNAEHPENQDPLYVFGVDDGEGYVDGDKRWRFIGAYLIYGQWKQAVLGGVRNLTAAYVVSGNKVYAHKAGVLFDRVADLYPTFDFAKEGLAYEKPHGSGYVSTWHDACYEVRELALAYDQVFDALNDDPELVTFLSHKAERFKMANPKKSFAAIQQNIEEGIFRDSLNNPEKIICNYPNTDITLAVIKTVLDWPANREEVCDSIDAVLQKASAVDGVTGEKGLANYSALVIQSVAMLLGLYSRLEPGFLRDALKRCPRLHAMYRFHIDTWCLQQYYPLVGDTGQFAGKIERYVGVQFQGAGASLGTPLFDVGMGSSMYSFLWQLYEVTGDEAFVQVLYRANGGSTDDLPYDLFADDSAAFQKAVQGVIDQKGTVPNVGSVNKEQWHLAILRSGQGADERALWVNYDAGRGHSHADGMNLGLFAKGLDLMPDFGYPPVGFGGWNSPQAAWYKMTASHNTVVVDGQNHSEAAGKTTLWADGKQFRAIRLSGPALIGGKQFERTVAMVDISERDFYIVDVFSVIGGCDHAKFMHSHFGRITTEGLALVPASEYGYKTQMRNFYVDPTPRPGWSVDWRIEDRYGIAPPGADIHLRYTDLTTDAQAFTTEAWVLAGAYTTNQEVWIPCVMVRRQEQEGPLASTFVSIIEPYEGTANIAQIRRLPLETVDGTAYPEPNVAVEIQLNDGSRDLFVATDDPLGLTPLVSEHNVIVQKEWGLRFAGELCHLRRAADGEVQRIVVCRGNYISIDDISVKLKDNTDFIEVKFAEGRMSMVSGKPEDIDELKLRHT